MIQSLHDLGRALHADNKYSSFFASYADPFAGYDGEAVVVVIDIEDGEVLEELSLEQYASQNAWRYLYRDPNGPRGAPLVATGPFYPMHKLETQAQREKQAENVEKIMSRIARSIPDGPSVYFASTEAKERGLAVIERLLKEQDGAKDKRFLYTVRIDKKYLGEFPELVEKLDDEAYLKYYEKSKGRGTCALTHAKDVEVWGRVDTLGFTVNDISFNRGGFDGKTSYRMFPVSKPAALALEAARRYAFAKLTDRFYTLEYLLIPRTLEERPELLLDLVRIIDTARTGERFEDKTVPIAKAEGVIDLVADEQGLNRAGVLFDLLFFQRNQAQLALLLHLQDIPPTRLGGIKAAINGTSLRYGRVFGYTDKKDKEFKPFRVNLNVVKNFFSTGKGVKINFDPFFFHLLEAIFHERKVNEATVLVALMDKIRIAFKNDGDDYHLPFHTTVHQAIATRSLLGALGLFHHPTYLLMEQHSEPIGLAPEVFIDQHQAFFKDQPALRGAFLIGVLTSMLTYAQYDSLKSKPFLNKLNNLNLGLEELRALVPQLLTKIHQYQSRKSGYSPSHFTVTDLAAEASSLLMQGGKPSRDDLSFAFTTGMVMQDKFAIDAARKRKAEGEDAESSTAS
ncbi:TM1802 family CRISPR-associated protein [Neolewinella lacunae]|uniref:Uncharacterized protein n=1 Tax=Neolewinella lacunae TaxID=1517758 RepID=A0A923T931_9BACT|nr:TM1802 family CRISPR-associated protein [Neolewinella lacunae]MBC6994618.1 hypothetical protein [Neolewinella lacunae]MDN3634490.1 TM1802 family CRISPR-associated protein [Neolewinella lacunae]